MSSKGENLAALHCKCWVVFCFLGFFFGQVSFMCFKE